MNDSARLLSCAGGLMAVSGILMAFSVSLPLAVLLWAAGVGFFAAAYLFSEKRKGETK